MKTLNGHLGLVERHFTRRLDIVFHTYYLTRHKDREHPNYPSDIDFQPFVCTRFVEVEKLSMVLIIGFGGNWHHNTMTIQ